MTQVSLECVAEMQAVYRCFGAQGQLLYVGVTGNLGRRLADHAQKSWFPLVSGITLTWYPDRESAEAAESLAIYIERPRYNVAGKGPVPVAGVAGPDAFALGPPHPSRRRAIELLGGVGRLGATPGWLSDRLKAEGMEVSRQTLQKWLAEDVESCRVIKVSYGRYAAAPKAIGKSARHRADDDSFPGDLRTLVAPDADASWPAGTQATVTATGDIGRHRNDTSGRHPGDS